MRVFIRRDTKKTEKIVGRSAGDRLHRFAAKPCDLFGNQRHIGGLVALSPVWNRREVRRIGLNQHAVERYAASNVFECLGVAKRHDPGKRNVKSQFQRGLGDRPGLGEAMHDTTDFARGLFARKSTVIQPGQEGTLEAYGRDIIPRTAG